MKRAVGYIRVSTKEQVSGESLSTQTESIKKWAKNNELELVEIYRDEGISGGTIEKRFGLQRCLIDGQKGQFDFLVVHRLSRFGRNARELLQNHQLLENKGIALYSISENIDFGNKYGKAMLGMFAVMAELERDIITEQLLENRIARAKKGFPVGGKPPAGRIYDRQQQKWKIDEEMARLLRWAAEQYIEGTSLREIAIELQKHGRKMKYSNLIKTLSFRCGDTYTINFKDEKEPIQYKIPPVLSEEMIEKVKERTAFNRRNNRTDTPKKYLLSGFLYCQDCEISLNAQTQKSRNGKDYQYYRHPKPVEEDKCFAFSKISGTSIENAVFYTIFENIIDLPSFEKAIEDSMPDETKIEALKETINRSEKELQQVKRDLDKIVEAVISGTLTKETVKGREKQLLDKKDVISKELDTAQKELNYMPDIEDIKKHAKEIRQKLLNQYGGKNRLKTMTFEEKRRLLHWLFDGKGPDGKPYGIYIKKHGKGQQAKVDYFMYGRISGLRTIKGDDFNYQNWDEDEEEDKDDLFYKTNVPPQREIHRFYNIGFNTKGFI